MPDALRPARNCAISSPASGGANHCLLFFTKICAAVNPQARARPIAWETPPLVEVWAPRSTPGGRCSEGALSPEIFPPGATGLGFVFAVVFVLALELISKVVAGLAGKALA